VRYLLGRGGGDGLHGSFGEVAAVGDGPFVVDLDQDGAGEAEQGFGVGEDTDDVGAAFDLLVDPLDPYLEPASSLWR
jgi:hypothetical protein